MKLNNEPANVLGRKHWWSDDVPRWMNRLAHYVCIWLLAGALTVPIDMWWKHHTFDQSLDWLVMSAIGGAVAYGIALLVYEVGRSRSHARTTSSGA